MADNAGINPVTYVYDGSFDGLLCCVYEAFYARETPFAIQTYDAAQDTLFAMRDIFTDEDKAQRVQDSIAAKISPEALELVQICYLSSMGDKELAVLGFLRLGYKIGARIIDMLANDAVSKVIKAVQNVRGEAHHFKGFLRFADYDGYLAAIIEPKNFILPIIAPHFVDRLNAENFLIYDKTHKHAFLYQDGAKKLMPLEHLELPPATEEEERYRALWKQFFDTIAIEGRISPKLQKGNLPLRYRKYMIEFD